MNKEIADALFDNDARVAALCHIGYMSLGEAEEKLQDLIEDFWDIPNLSSLLGLSVKERCWLDKAQNADEIVQALIDIGKTGFLIELTGSIYEQHPTIEELCSSTGFSTSELAYAHTAADIDQAILDALERLKPRLRRPAKTQPESP